MNDELNEKYNLYRSVQGAEISIQASEYLCNLISERQPKLIFDLGSGWTSYLTRKLCPDAIVWSVDDNMSWMHKTIEFCRSNNVNLSRFITWHDLREICPAYSRKADLVIHDLGNRETRIKAMGVAFDLVRPGGIIIQDDMHKGQLLEAVQEIVDNGEWNIVDKGELTSDPQTRPDGTIIQRWQYVLERK